MLIDKLHHAGIGAIMDFVPVHFAVDSYGLAKYDGTHLYEYPHSAVGESEWGATISFIPDGKYAVFCSLRPITGSLSFILTVCAWMRSRA